MNKKLSLLTMIIAAAFAVGCGEAKVNEDNSQIGLESETVETAEEPKASITPERVDDDSSPETGITQIKPEPTDSVLATDDGKSRVKEENIPTPKPEKKQNETESNVKPTEKVKVVENAPQPEVEQVQPIIEQPQPVIEEQPQPVIEEQPAPGLPDLNPTCEGDECTSPEIDEIPE